MDYYNYLQSQSIIDGVSRDDGTIDVDELMRMYNNDKQKYEAEKNSQGGSTFTGSGPEGVTSIQEMKSRAQA